MTQKERLVKMIDESTGAVYKGDIIERQEIDITKDEIERIADHLLANGVIVPPCKVGAKAYHLTTVDTLSEFGEIFEGVVKAITKEEMHIWIYCIYDNGLSYHYTESDIGKRLFFSKEEAEAKLAERSKKDGI